jgi:hypothetical protein
LQLAPIPLETWILWILLLASMAAPVLLFLFLPSGWAARKQEVLTSLALSFSDYVYAFQPEKAAQMTGPWESRQIVEEVFLENFGKRTFIWPAVLLTLGMAVSLYLISAVDIIYSAAPDDGSRAAVSPLAMSAVLGAVTFVLFDFTAKCIRRSIAPPDLLWAGFRFLVSVPLVYSFVSVLNEDVGLAGGFAFGAFPTKTLVSTIRRIGRKQMNMEEGPAEEKSNLTTLHSLDVESSERLMDENITNVLQLANCDPIVVAIRTNIGLPTILDYVNQALLWIHVKGKLTTFQSLGIRGANEFQDAPAKLRAIATTKTKMSSASLSFIKSRILKDDLASLIYSMSLVKKTA